jgi:protein-disulfide isomerase
VYRHFPLKTLHANADLASRAAEAAGRQGNIWSVLDLLYTEQPNWSQLDSGAARDVFKGFAEQLKLDLDRFNADLDEEEVDAAVDADVASGKAAGVSGTPTFFLNGSRLEATSVSDFSTAIDTALGL